MSKINYIVPVALLALDLFGCGNSTDGSPEDGTTNLQDQVPGDFIDDSSPVALNPSNLVIPARGDVSISYDGAGIDGAWHTKDDEILSYTISAHDENGNLTYTATFIEPGNDGVWFNTDDKVQGEHVFYEYNGNNKLYEIWLTDTGIDRWFKYEYDNLGQLSRKIIFRHRGIDVTWFTNDDVLWAYVAYKYYDDGKLEKSIFYFDPNDGPAGPDGTVFTADDNIDSYMFYKYNESGQVILTSRMTYSGPDGIWFTDDDGAFFRNTNQYFTSYNISIPNHGYGTDGIPFTTDDIIMGYIKNMLNDQGNLQKSIEFGRKGPDDTWFTDDDIIERYRLHEYYPDGSRKNRYVFLDPGIDGIWFTEDDSGTSNSSLTHFDYDTSGKVTQSIFTHSGPDLIFNTGDDEIASYTKYLYDAQLTGNF